jgi:choice-of-anchor B domain-containing protein
VIASRRLAGLLLAACVGACGGDSTTSTPAAVEATPSPAVASLNMTLRSHLDLDTLGQSAQASHGEVEVNASGPSGSGNWGYTTPSGRRFALIGTSVGLAIVEVSDPRRPRRVALIAGEPNAWREVKTYGPYVYVTTEAKTGLDIVDMSDPDRPEKVRTWNETFNSAHSLWIDQDRGLLYAHGTATGMHVLDLSRDPTNPRELSVFAGFYIHDSYGRGDRLYAAAIYDGFLSILDVGDPSRVRELSRFSTGGRFTHNAWLTRDGRYVFTTDERPGRPLEGWDIRVPESPRKVSEYIARTGTIPHNVMVDGDRLLVAHYTEGVRLLDVRDPERPAVLGFYDTYDGTSTGFAGAWGAYIFPGSNLIVVSDINGGLYVIEYTGR